MRELTTEEMDLVAGGDGFHLGGNNYISTTRRITGGLGLFGAAVFAAEIGYGIGRGLEHASGGALSTAVGGFVYERS